MNILVCVKQVPDTAEIKIDPVKNTLIRAGVPSIVNPFDAYALELAVQLKEKHGGTVTVVSMGPEQAKVALKECLSVGADRAILISDRKFGGSDTLATSYILSSVIEKLGKFDIIFCGKQAIDGDTGQVGAGIAENLEIAQITYATDIELNGQTLKVKREIEEGYEILEVGIPALITVTKNKSVPRYPTIKSKMKANKAIIDTITSEDINIDYKRIGLKGSPTKVKKTFIPSIKTSGEKKEGLSPKEAVDSIIHYMADLKLM